MTEIERRAFNAGTMAILDLAERSAAAIESIMILRPTRFNHAAAALRGLAEEGRTLLKDAGGGLQDQMTPSQPKPPNGLSGGAAKALAANVERIPVGDDGNYGLSDAEIARPSRETIVNWLAGRTPMMASHWSKIAARMLQDDRALLSGEKASEAVHADLPN